MVKIGGAFFVSSVEVRVATRRFPKPVNGYDRDAGVGVGHLFKIDQQGNLLASLTLGEGDAYHPGGIDYDGRHIWVPVSEYRPDSRSIIYKVDPETMKPVEVFRFPDSIGAIVHNTDDRTLHGVSWGSRRFYRWTMDADGRVTNATRHRQRCRRSTRHTTWTIRTASTWAAAACCAPASPNCARQPPHLPSGWAAWTLSVSRTAGPCIRSRFRSGPRRART